VWIQVGIGIGIWMLAAPRGALSRLAGLVSVGWGLVVCVLGESFGSIFAPGHVAEDARRRRVEVEHFGSEVLEPSFGKQACQLVGCRLRSGGGGTGTAGLGYQSYAPAGPQ
jgi:hypothetical protein